jgi:hypothetical protein
MAGVQLAAIMEGLLVALGSKALDLALDPAFNEALSPSEGLTVTPLMFGSTEQEGRWKLEEWHYNHDRILSNPILVGPVASPADRPVKDSTKRVCKPLLTITIQKPPNAYDFLSTLNKAIEALRLPIEFPVVLIEQIAKNSILQDASAEISADWQHDELEIWGGFAGLTNAKGFSSVFGHRASVQLNGTVYGNYLPGSYLIGITGFVNPVGPKYVEFRCAAVIQAGKPIQSLWGERWDRDGGKPTKLEFTQDKGFNLAINP